jgi:iron complex outermembrane receptor protein
MAEIVVTAQKREENLQDVPISISAFSGDELEARGVTSPTALAAITPGLTYNNLVGYSLVYIRGVGSDAFEPTADQSVATYIDGVYLPFAHGLAQEFV